jgi:hypothetical protein
MRGTTYICITTLRGRAISCWLCFKGSSARLPQDIIPRTGKMGCIFKHVGHFAYLNERGDLRVRPSYVDVRLDVRRRSRKVKDHLCEAYRQAFVAV